MHTGKRVGGHSPFAKQNDASGGKKFGASFCRKTGTPPKTHSQNEPQTSPMHRFLWFVVLFVPISI